MHILIIYIHVCIRAYLEGRQVESCIYMYMHIYIYIHICVCVCVCVCVCMCLCIYVYAYMNMCIATHIRRRTTSCGMQTYVYTYMNMCILNMCVYIYENVHWTCVYLYEICVLLHTHAGGQHVAGCKRICEHILKTYVYTYLNMRIHNMCIYIYENVHWKCVWICVLLHTHAEGRQVAGCKRMCIHIWICVYIICVCMYMKMCIEHVYTYNEHVYCYIHTQEDDKLRDANVLLCTATEAFSMQALSSCLRLYINLWICTYLFTYICIFI